MWLIKIGCIFLIYIATTEVYSWTIDLPEARKFFFEQADKHEQHEQEIKQLNKKKLFADNIRPDSPHNRDELRPEHEHHEQHEQDERNDVYGNGQYAEEYEYMSYMEKKVHGIVHNGSVYLEGLRLALEDYGELLKNCRRQNFTQPQSPNGPWLPENDPRQSNGNFGNQPGSPGSTSNQQGPFGTQPGSSSSQPGSNNNQTGSFNGMFEPTSNVDYETCDRATKSSEHVRRLAELALWATRELQDKAYNDKYKGQGHDEEEKEAELLVRLAFFLDRLAYFTGYEPKPGQFITDKPDRPTTTTPGPNSVMGEVPEDVKDMMANCLGSENTSSEAATERCKYPLPYPDFIKRIFNVTDPPDTVQSVSTEPYQPKNPSFMETFKNPNPRQWTNRRTKREISSDQPEDRSEKGSDDKSRDKRAFLVQALLGPKIAHKILEGIHEELEHEHLHHHFEDLHHRRHHLLEKLKVLKNSHKKLVEFISHIRHRHELEKALEHELHEHEHHAHAEHEHEIRIGFKEKRDDSPHTRQPRSVENPLLEVMKYYVKHKVWDNSNQHNPGDIDIANQVNEALTPDEHQAPTDELKLIRIQKRSIDNKKHEHLKLPEDPSQDLSNYVKHRRGVNYITDENATQKLRQYLDKIAHSKSATAKEYARKVLKRRPRAVEYGRKYRPSPAENPSRDITYYVKNKEGTIVQSDGVQARLVRQNLEQIFQYPSIEVVRRYGSNQNPLIPLPINYGVAQTFFGDI
ncbi:hypothetical protein O0L34_g5738 [Tuta absoluta]|nr:hypothetical protein O0L34_g5738 [Tuta absoluta]